MGKNITIQTGQIHEYHGTETAPRLRVFVKKNFIAYDNNVVQHSPLDLGDFFDEQICTVNAGVVTYPQFTIYSTDDALSDPDLSTYSFALFDQGGRLLGIVLRDIRIPASPTSTSLAALAIYSGATTPVVDAATTYTDAEIDSRIAAQLTGLVLITDPVWNAVVDKKYLTEYADLDAAIADIAAFPSELVVTEASSVMTANSTIPATCKLSFEGPGSIAIPAGTTLTINGPMDDPGNKQVFVQADATANVRFGVGAVEKMNVAWFVGPSGGSITNALTQIVASATANGKGHIYIPGGSWTAAGGYDLPQYCRVTGDGKGNTVLGFSAGSTYMFRLANGIRNFTAQGFDIDVNGQTGTTGFLFEVPDAAGSNGQASIRSVRLNQLGTGVSLHSTGGISGQVAHILIDHDCYIRACDIGVYANSINSGLRCEAFIECSSSQVAFQMDAIGELEVRGEAAGRAWTGRAQVLRQILAGSVTSDGNLTVTIKAAGMNAGTPEVITVPVTNGLTAAQAAALVRLAIGINPKTGSFFHPTGTGANAEIIPIDAVANDATMTFTIDGAATGITNVAATAATTLSTGVADTTQPKVLVLNGPCSVINFIDFQEEAFKSLIENNYAGEETVINFWGSLAEDKILMSSGQVNMFGGKVYDRAVRDNAGGGVFNCIGTYVIDYYYNSDGNTYTLDRKGKRAHNFGATCIVGIDSVQGWNKVVSMAGHRVFQNTQTALDAEPLLELGSSMPAGVNRKELLWLGKTDENGNRLYGFTFERDNVTYPGHLTITGNQSGAFNGLRFNGPFRGSAFLANLPFEGIGYETGAGGVGTQPTLSSDPVTINALSGQITTVALTTAAGAEEKFTFTNNKLLATDFVGFCVQYTGHGTPQVTSKNQADGSLDIVITNIHASTALDALVVINFWIGRTASS